MSSPIDGVFGKLAKLQYRLSIHSTTALMLANGEFALQREQTVAKGGLALGKISRYYADDTKLSIFKEASIISSYEVELVLRRTIPHYHVELWLRNKIWYSWTADASPYDDLVYCTSITHLVVMAGQRPTPSF